MNMYTSHADMTLVLSSRLKYSNDLRDTTLDDDWVTMLRDHKNHIRAHSTIKNLDSAERYKYEYRPHKLLESISGSSKSLLAFCIANNFSNINELNRKLDSPLYIPNASYIDELRFQYKTTKSLEEKLKLPKR